MKRVVMMLMLGVWLVACGKAEEKPVQPAAVEEEKTVEPIAVPTQQPRLPSADELPKTIPTEEEAPAEPEGGAPAQAGGGEATN